MGEGETFVWEEIEPAMLSPINELCGRRRRLCFRCFDSEFALRLDPPVGLEGVTAGLHFRVQGMGAWLGLPSFAFLGEVDPELAPYWCSEYAGEGELGRIAAEAAWEPFAEALERAGGGSAWLSGMGVAPDRGCSVCFLLRVDRDGRSWLTAPLALEPRLAQFWSKVLRPSPAGKGRLSAELPVRLSLTAGQLALDLSTLRRLKRGDLLFPDEPFPGNPMVVNVDGVPWGKTALDESGTKSMIRVVPNANLTGEDPNPMDPDAASPIAEIPVLLTFELGRRQVPLGELETLKGGFIFELDREAKRPVLILANGRTIGTGELVKVGERVGIRIVELCADAAP